MAYLNGRSEQRTALVYQLQGSNNDETDDGEVFIPTSA